MATERPPWMMFGACRPTPVPTEDDSEPTEFNFYIDAMYPTPGDEDGIETAKSFCAICPAVDACLEYALATNQKEGVWGGMDEIERRRYRRNLLRRRRETRAAVQAGAVQETLLDVPERARPDRVERLSELLS